jgi:hypothetical integral membrane protein (TIGR02206 family)
MPDSFTRFSSAHIGAVSAIVTAPLMLCAVARWDATGSASKVIRWALVALLIGDRAFRILLLHCGGELTIESAAPMHLCDWASIAAAITMAYPNQWTYELCYFWAMGGTLQAVISPDLAYGFPDPRFITFFISHGGVITAALYATLCMGMRPVPMSIVRVLGWSAVYLVVAMAVNFLFDANFGYLRGQPSRPSPMDYLAPWPQYIVQLAALAIASTFLYYAPFFVIDRLKRE